MPSKFASTALITSILLSNFVAPSVVMAARLQAFPFVAADRPDTTDFHAEVSSGSGSPLSVSTNTAVVPVGTYAGVLITAKNQQQVTDFRKLTFSFKGPESTRVVARFQRPGRSSFELSALTIGAGDIGVSANHKADGYQTIALEATQFGITPDCRLDKIVISSDQASGVTSFLVKDIRINGLPVSKNLSEKTLFYPIAKGTGSGPLEQTGSQQHLGSSHSTGVTITNGLSTQQQFLIKLSGGSFSNVTQIPLYTFNPRQPLSRRLKITKTGTSGVGTFTLGAKQTAYYVAPLNLDVALYCPVDANNIANQCGPPNSCSGSANVGATFVEVNVNTSTLDVVDISEVNGVNAQWQIVTPPERHYCCTWSSGAYLQPSSAPNPQQYIPITKIVNHPGAGPCYYGDYGNPGVYAFGCDLGTSRSSPGCVSDPNYPVSYPGGSSFVNTGCDSASYNPSGISALPADAFSPYSSVYPQSSYGFNQANQTPSCTDSTGHSVQCRGGVIAITLLQYPWCGCPDPTDPRGTTPCQSPPTCP